MALYPRGLRITRATFGLRLVRMYSNMSAPHHVIELNPAASPAGGIIDEPEGGGQVPQAVYLGDVGREVVHGNFSSTALVIRGPTDITNFSVIACLLKPATCSAKATSLQMRILVVGLSILHTP